MKLRWKQVLKKLSKRISQYAIPLKGFAIALVIILSFAFPALADGSSVEAEVMEMSFADMGPLKTSGSVPSFRDSIYSTEGELGLREFDTALSESEAALVYNPAREWFEGQYPADVVKVGDLMGTNIGVEALTLDYLSQNTNIDLSGATLSEISFLQGVTVNDLIGNVPYLGEYKVSDLGGFAGATGLEGFDGTVIEAVREVPDIGELLVTDEAIGTLPVSDIPNLATTPIGTIPGVGNNVISNVPGLEDLDFGKYPGFDLAEGLIPIAKQDIVFGQTEYSGTVETPNPVSGGTDGTNQWKPIACSGGCAHLELMDADISPVKGAWTGANWMTREHRVKDGWGVLGAMFSEAGAYRVPFGDVFALQVTKTDEKTATAEWGLAFRVCSNGLIDLGCTAYFLEVDLPITTSEKATILTGLNDDKGGASQPMDAPPGWEALRPASPKELQAVVDANTPRRRRGGGGSLCGKGPGGVDYEALSGAFGVIESNIAGYSSVGIYVNGGLGGQGQPLMGRGLGKYQYMSYREDVVASISQQEGGEAFLSKVESGADVSQADVDKYFPASEQDAIFRSDQEELINKAISEGHEGGRIIERVGQLHYGGLGAGIDSNARDDLGRLSVKEYGEELLAAYDEKIEGGDSVCKSTGSYINPLKDGTLPGDRLFGTQFHPIHKEYRMHAGHDLPGDSGDEVVAADGGIVTYAQVSGSLTSGYGNLIIVDHGDGRESYYAHLEGFNVQEGDRVAQGQTIGYVGSTGGSTGAHLHYENRVNGVPVDPSIGTDYAATEPKTPAATTKQ
jgi:murein DD-endopeptidase MepM/ murein hydrolase activator NlpD